MITDGLRALYIRVAVSREPRSTSKSRHQRREQVRRQHIDREHALDTVHGLDPARLAGADRGVVDHRVGAARLVRLGGQRPHVGEARELTDQDRLGARLGAAGVVGARRYGCAA
jgi:hypothetical protein